MHAIGFLMRLLINNCLYNSAERLGPSLFFINMLTALNGFVLFLFAQERCGYDNRLQVVSDCAKKISTPLAY